MATVIIQSACTLLGCLIAGYVSIAVAKSENAKSIAIIQNEVKNIKENINDIKENFKEDINRLEVKQDKHNNLMERVFKLEERVNLMK